MELPVSVRLDISCDVSKKKQLFAKASWESREKALSAFVVIHLKWKNCSFQLFFFFSFCFCFSFCFSFFVVVVFFCGVSAACSGCFLCLCHNFKGGLIKSDKLRLEMF